MTDENKKDALEALDSIRTRGCTNIWAGLEESMMILHSNKITSNQRSVFLLTDGQPNVIPPRGHIPMLKRFKDKNPDACKIFTYGFGYKVDSELLNQLACHGNGNYYMIPDSSFLGTIFEHSLANMVTSFTSNVSVMIENQENNKLVKCYNTYINDEQNWGGKYNFGPLQYGSDKNFIFEFEKPINTSFDIFIEYQDYRTNNIIKNSYKCENVLENSKIYENYLR